MRTLYHLPNCSVNQKLSLKNEVYFKKGLNYKVSFLDWLINCLFTPIPKSGPIITAKRWC